MKTIPESEYIKELHFGLVSICVIAFNNLKMRFKNRIKLKEDSDMKLILKIFFSLNNARLLKDYRRLELLKTAKSKVKI